MNLKSFLTILMLTPVFITSVNAQKLSPGDGLRVTFFNINEEISGDYFIQANSEIQLPYLGMIKTDQNEFEDLREFILSEYSKIYRKPELSVQPLYRVGIIGEVGNPGVYYLTGYETISDLIAIAGGETNDSDLDDLYLIRQGTNIEIDLENYLEGKNKLVDMGLKSGDKIYVSRKWLAGARDASVLVSGIAVLVAIASLFTR